MTKLRQRIAERLVSAKNTAAMLNVVNMAAVFLALTKRSAMR